MERKKLLKAVVKSTKPIINSAPILGGVILLISIITVVVPSTVFASIFKGNEFLNTLIGSTLGSILAGNPVTSYIIGGELLTNGVSLTAVTAFLVAWVTVGLIQLPAETMLLGKRFAITRNITAFIFSMIVAIITVFMVNLI